VGGTNGSVPCRRHSPCKRRGRRQTKGLKHKEEDSQTSGTQDRTRRKKPKKNRWPPSQKGKDNFPEGTGGNPDLPPGESQVSTIRVKEERGNKGNGWGLWAVKGRQVFDQANRGGGGKGVRSDQCEWEKKKKEELI